MLASPSDSESKDNDSAVTAALKSASLMMQQRIISQPKDMMGILFFGTKKTKFRDNDGSNSQYPHCFLHTNMDIPSAEVVRSLKSLAEDGEDPDGILSPAGGEPPIRDMLFCANQVFTTGAPNFGSRRLFIVTDNDDPFGGDKEKRRQAAVRAKDLFDLGVTVELFPISHDERKFDLEKLYTVGQRQNMIQVLELTLHRISYIWIHFTLQTRTRQTRSEQSGPRTGYRFSNLWSLALLPNRHQSVPTSPRWVSSSPQA